MVFIVTDYEKKAMTQNRDHKAESIREFDRNARDYDHRSPFYYRMTRLCDNAVMERLSALQLAASRLLDVGCGTGALLEKLSSRFPCLALDGIDISPKMLDIARGKDIPRLSLAHGDAEELPYPDGTFGAVLCCSSFHHYPHPERALSEFLRVLVPGGYAVVCDMNLPAVARVFANHILFPLQRKGDVHVYTRREFASLMESQGFTRCSVRRITAFEWLATGRKNSLD